MAVTIKNVGVFHPVINPYTDWFANFTLKLDGTAVNLTDYEIFWVWLKVGSPHEVLHTFSTTTTGIEWIDQANGQWRVTPGVDDIWEAESKEKLWFPHTMYLVDGNSDKQAMLEGIAKVGINV